ncbi:uncharacterized protein LOC135094965 [Scylla paramamosain]|uniref:uncharacterized protein LOC135094965 n=1 Tax=Scylla paramamosain TaxID=85552 RepID=UPI003083AC34
MLHFYDCPSAHSPSLQTSVVAFIWVNDHSTMMFQQPVFPALVFTNCVVFGSAKDLPVIYNISDFILPTMVSKCPAGSTDCLTKAKRARTSINLEMKLVILRQHTGGEGMNAFVCLLDLAQSSVSIVLKNTASEKQVKLALCSWQRRPPHLLTTLRCISRACPDDPMVLEQVNLYLHSLEHRGPALERAVMWMRSAESDSGQESSDECPGPTNASCTLRTTGKMEVLMRCLSLLVAMLDYPAHTWDLQRWQKLTQVLTKFYQAWVHVEVISNPDYTISRGQVMCTSHLQLCHKSSEVLLSFCCYQVSESEWVLTLEFFPLLFGRELMGFFSFLNLFLALVCLLCD